MSLVCRVAYSTRLTKSKYERLCDIAKRAGNVRDLVWHQYGGLKSFTLDFREIRDAWASENKITRLPNRLWRATLNDACNNIKLSYASAKTRIIKDISKITQIKEDRKKLCLLLDSPNIIKHNKLHKSFRKHFKHGQNRVYNQIVLDCDSYRVFERGGRTWLALPSLVSRKRINIPLDCKTNITGRIRVILKNGTVGIHYAVEVEDVCSVRPCGTGALGVDKGYTETFTDSDGVKHGIGLGMLLTKESDYLKSKQQNKHKIRAVANKKPHKAQNIKKNNLGRKKLLKRKASHNKRTADLICKSVHSVLDKASVVVSEDLTFVYKRKSVKPKKKRFMSKDMKRRLSGWEKGVLADKLHDISKRRGATLHLVNAAYTSQICYTCNTFGDRNGDVFYCTECKVEYDADHNAAMNILGRLDDDEIGRYTSYAKVKDIILYRNSQRLGQLNQDSSYSPHKVLLTESELPVYVNSA